MRRMSRCPLTPRGLMNPRKDSRMNVTILGAGAMGSLFGGLLAAHGHAVELLDVNEAHIAEIQNAGLTLDTDQGRQNVRVRACRPEQGTTPPDWLIVFTKTLHTDSALRAAQHLIGPHTCVLSLQNGLGNVEKLQTFVPRERIAIVGRFDAVGARSVKSSSRSHPTPTPCPRPSHRRDRASRSRRWRPHGSARAHGC